MYDFSVGSIFLRSLLIAFSIEEIDVLALPVYSLGTHNSLIISATQFWQENNRSDSSASQSTHNSNHIIQYVLKEALLSRT